MFRSKQTVSLISLLLTFILYRNVFGEEVSGRNLAHEFAQQNLIFELIDLAHQHKDFLYAKDSNGWTPLHEGAKNGHVLVVLFLVSNGADPNAKTSDGAKPRDLLHDEGVLVQEDTTIKERYNLVQTVLVKAEGGQGYDGLPIKKNSNELVTHFTHLAHALVHLQVRQTVISI